MVRMWFVCGNFDVFPYREHIIFVAPTALKLLKLGPNSKQANDQ